MPPQEASIETLNAKPPRRRAVYRRPRSTAWCKKQTLGLFLRGASASCRLVFPQVSFLTNVQGTLTTREEKFRAEDEANKHKIEAKNGLENYCFTMRNTLNEEKLKDKFEGGDKEKIEAAVQETLDWLDKNQLAEKDEFEAKQKELEGVVNPIMMKVYQAAGGGGMPEGGMPGGGMGGAAPGGASGPTVEEVD